MSKMRTIAEDTDEVEKDETNMEKEKKEVENMFAEKGWTVNMSKKRMKKSGSGEGSSERPLRVLHVTEFKDHLRAAPIER